MFCRTGICDLKTPWSQELIVLCAMAALCACATSHGSSSGQPPSAAQSESHHIYVTSAGLNEACYQNLGQLTLKKSFAQSVVESPDTLAQEMRDLAWEKYADNVDAVVAVHEQQDAAGTTVEIAGQAVHLQNHETVACAARSMPEIVDSASATAAGGIAGTVIGGLAGNGGSVYGAEAGGDIGATAAAGRELVKRQEQKRAQEAFIGDRLKQQQSQIAQLYQELSKLIGQQCDEEELSEQDCEKRIIAVQQQIAVANGAGPTSASTTTVGGSSEDGATTEFDVVNRIQEQQEIIDQLQRRIAEIKRNTDTR